MPWSTPTLKDVRAMVRDNVTSVIPQASLIGNSVLRVVSDAQGALAHLVLRYIDWLALQFLPDTAETEWLDRHGNIWLRNADGSKGRKIATFAKGSGTMTGTFGTIVPAGTQLLRAQTGVRYQTLETIVMGHIPTPVGIQALSSGANGNLETGDLLNLVVAISGVDSQLTVIEVLGGTDPENDAELRDRVLERIQKPPMGGDKDDFVAWAKSVAGVTRAWCFPLEMGIGTVTVRFMMDDLRADADGFPDSNDVLTVQNYLDIVRPVAVKDFFVVAPIPFPVDVHITNLEDDNSDVRAAIEASLLDMFKKRSSPGQTIWHSWVSEAISAATDEDHHDLDFTDAVLPGNGYMPVLGTITYG